MAYSSIIQKPCKCGCGSMPTLGFQGYFSGCRPDLVAAKIKKQNNRQYQKGKLNKEVREQLQNGDYDKAERQALMNDLDFVFSRITRIMGSDERGMCQCYTCPTVKHYTLMQCGHYESRKNTQIRWSFTNSRPQCQVCNEVKHGNLEVFTANLETEQPGITEQLKEMAREPFKWGRNELKQLLSDLRQRLRLIETKFKPQ